jgi:hypothetical protein
VVQQPLPLLVLRRAAKAFLVRGEAGPAHEEQVLVGVLDAAAHLVRQVAGHRRDDRLGLRERGLEVARGARLHAQAGHLEDHVIRP